MMVWVGIRVFGRVQEGLGGSGRFPGKIRRVWEGLIASKGQDKPDRSALVWKGPGRFVWIREGSGGSGRVREGP